MKSPIVAADARLTAAAAIVLRLATIANRLFFLAVAAVLVLSFPFATQAMSFLADSSHPASPADMLAGLRWELLVGVVMATATDYLLDALAHMLASARVGDPFVAANASRLRTIGWSLLVLQLLDIPGMALRHFYPDLGDAAPDGGISIGGWVSVLMVFILARIFAAGAAMRDELAATV